MGRPKKKSVLNQGTGRSGAKLKVEESTIGYITPEPKLDIEKIVKQMEPVEEPVSEVVPEKPEQPIEVVVEEKEEETVQTQLGTTPKSISNLSADEYRRWQRTGKMPQ